MIDLCAPHLIRSVFAGTKHHYVVLPISVVMLTFSVIPLNSRCEPLRICDDRAGDSGALLHFMQRQSGESRWLIADSLVRTTFLTILSFSRLASARRSSMPAADKWQVMSSSNQLVAHRYVRYSHHHVHACGAAARCVKRFIPRMTAPLPSCVIIMLIRGWRAYPVRTLA